MRVAMIVLLMSTAAAFAQTDEPRDDAPAISGGLCIGTVEECAERSATTRQGFDMRVDFGHDSADLTPDARARLAEFADALKANRLKQRSFVLEGHTDAYGQPDYNMSLSERRAKAVAEYLTRQGVESERVKAVGKGVTAPRTDDPYDPANRRVEMRVE